MTAYTAGERPGQAPRRPSPSAASGTSGTPRPRQERRPWDDLTRLLSRHAVRREKDGPLWSPVRFCPGTARGGGQRRGRHGAGLRRRPRRAGLEPAGRGGLRRLHHLQPHGCEDTPLARSSCRLARPVPAGRVARVWRRGAGPLRAQADPACRTPAGCTTCPPARRAGPGGRAIGEGAPVDPAGLPETPEEVQERELAAAGPAGPAARGRSERGSARATASPARRAGRRSSRRTAGARAASGGAKRCGAGPGGRTTGRRAARTRPATATCGSGRATPRRSSPAQLHQAARPRPPGARRGLERRGARPGRAVRAPRRRSPVAHRRDGTANGHAPPRRGPGPVAGADPPRTGRLPAD